MGGGVGLVLNSSIQVYLHGLQSQDRTCLAVQSLKGTANTRIWTTGDLNPDSEL